MESTAIDLNNERHASRFWLAAALLGLVVPMAMAGPKEDTEQAELEFKRGGLVIAMDLWQKAAEAGYAPAQARLGDMLDKAEDNAAAVEWYRKAAAQGDAAGEYGLGGMYARGEGVAKDDAQAFKLIESAAAKSHVPAMIMMRDIYRLGSIGITPDPAKSAEWDAKLAAVVPRKEVQPTAAAPAPATSGRRRK